MNKNLHIYIGVLLFVVVVVAQIYVVFAPSKSLLNWFTTDDAFYYFKVARNITEGKGITFDGINPTNGFHPLWMLICIPLFTLARLDPFLPLRGVILVSILLSAGTSVLIYQILRRVISLEASLLAAVFYAFYKSIHFTVVEGGMESGISSFFLALLVYLATRWEQEEPAGQKRWISLAWVGLAGGLTALSRLDNVFIIGMIGVWLMLRSFRNRSLLILDALTIVGTVLFSYQSRLLGIGFSTFTGSALVMLAASLIFRIGAYNLAGLYRHPKSYPLKSFVLRMVLASLGASFFTAVVMLVAGRFNLFPSFPRAILLIEGILSFLGALVLRGAYAFLVPINAADHKPTRLLDWKQTFQTGLAFFAPVGVILVIYMGYNYLTLGTFMPISGQIKQWWSTLPNSVYGGFGERALDYAGYSLAPNGPWGLINQLFEPAYLALFGWLKSKATRMAVSGVVIATLLVWVWLGSKKDLSEITNIFLVPLVAGNTLQLLYYGFSGFSAMRYWYWAGQIFVITLALAILVDVLFDVLRRLTGHQLWPRLLVTVTGLFLLVIFVRRMIHLAPFIPGGSAAETYTSSIDAVATLTQPGDVIASPGNGYIGYFLDDRTFVNLDGLINSPDYFIDLKTGNVPAFLEKMKVKYVYGSEYMLTESQPYTDFFKDRLEYIQQAGDQILFQYFPPSK